MNLLSRKSILLGISLLTTFLPAAQAQNEQDAIRFSFLQPQGTARSIGFGSALGSIGGDFSSLSVNPAGIGIYRRSEVTFSPSLTFAGTSASYAGNSSKASGSHFAFSNLGLVTTKVAGGRRGSQNDGWTSVSFGLGLTRLADFTRNYDYSGINTTSSGSFAFEADANNLGLDPDANTTLGTLGYQAYLLDTLGTGWISVVNPKSNAPVNQLTSITERGGISELGISFGGSYQDRLMIGGTIGLPIVRYLRTKTFTERDLSGNTNNDFDYFTFNDELKTTGAGINLKLGFIYKPTDNFRFGAAIHTPSYISLSDIQNRSLTANTEGFGGFRNESMVENIYDYSISTPWRAIISATTFLGSFGFLTADYEYIDYGSAAFNFDPADKTYQQEVNNIISQSLGGASNIRTGLEIRLDNFQIRGGFGYYGNPYKEKYFGGVENPNLERFDFSAGLGFRFPNAFIDLGFVHREYKSSEQPYYLSGVPYAGLIIPTAQLSTGSNTAVVTFGFKL